MHHAPAGPRLSARVAGLLARLRFRVAPLLAVLRRTRVLPVALAAVALGAIALAAPLAPYDDDARSTAALAEETDDGLVPATGDGWTQDGVPAPSSADEKAARTSRASSSSASSGSVTSGSVTSSTDGSSPTAQDTAGEPSSTGTTTSAGTSSSSSSTSSSSSSTAPSSSGSPTSSPVETPTGETEQAPEPEAPAPVADPTAAALAVVNSARSAAGCAALVPDGGLSSLAAAHVLDGVLPDLGNRTALTATGSDPTSVGTAWAGDAAVLDCGLTSAGVATTDGSWLLLAS